MIPSEKYAVDTTTEVNGVTLKWTKPIREMYEFGDGMDLSIAYTTYADSIMYTVYKKFGWSMDDLRDMNMPYFGQNPSGANQHLTGWTRGRSLEPTTRPFIGVVLTNKIVNRDNSGCYVTGVNIGKEEVLEKGDFGYKRLLLDFDINKMLFRIRLWGWHVDDWEGVEDKYEYEPESSHAPSTREITLRELWENPDDYEITSITLSSASIYNEETGTWGATNIYPALIISDDGINTEGFSGDFPFNGSTPTFTFTHRDDRNVSITGGISYTFPYKMDYDYILGFTDEFEIAPFNSLNYEWILTNLGTQGNVLYGFTDDWSHDMYFCHEKYELGDHILHCCTRAHPISYRVEPPLGELSHTIGSIASHGYLAIKGSVISRYIAGFGLYYADDFHYNPANTGVTPETYAEDDHIMLGEMYTNVDNRGMTTGRWLKGEALRDYQGDNKDGKTINPHFIPHYPNPPTQTYKGRRIKIILPEYSKQIKLKTPRRNCR